MLHDTKKDKDTKVSFSGGGVWVASNMNCIISVITICIYMNYLQNPNGHTASFSAKCEMLIIVQIKLMIISLT